MSNRNLDGHTLNITLSYKKGGVFITEVHHSEITLTTAIKRLIDDGCNFEVTF